MFISLVVQKSSDLIRFPFVPFEFESDKYIILIKYFF